MVMIIIELIEVDWCMIKYILLQIVGIPYSTKIKDGNEYMEYQNDEVSSTVCQAIVKQAYTRFRLFMGSFETILNEVNVGSVTLLKHKLDYFYCEVWADK